MPHQFDVYGHKLINTKDQWLEAKINRLAEELYELASTEGMTDRAKSIRTELYTCCVSFFRVVGQGIEYGGDPFEEVLIDLLMYQTNYESTEERARFDPSKGSFVNCIRFLFPKRVKDAGHYEDEQSADDTLDAREGEAPTDFDDRFGIVEDPLNHIKATALYVELLTLAAELKREADLEGEDRDTDSVASAGRSMSFTEAITYLIKLEDEKGLEDLQHHERDTFRAMAIEFLDFYMEKKCRTILAVLMTDVLLGYRSRYGWPLLSNSAYVEFFKVYHDREISTSAVSQYRGQFQNQVRRLPAFSMFGV